MSNPAPVLHLPGTIRSAVERPVDAVDASPAERDDQGRIVREARDARGAYMAVDLTVLTDDGGFANVVMRRESVREHWDDTLPERGAACLLPVRPYTQWEGRPGRKYPTIRYAVVADMLGDFGAPAKPAATSSRPSLAATGS